MSFLLYELSGKIKGDKDVGWCGLHSVYSARMTNETTGGDVDSKVLVELYYQATATKNVSQKGFSRLLSIFGYKRNEKCASEGVVVQEIFSFFQ